MLLRFSVKMPDQQAYRHAKSTEHHPPERFVGCMLKLNAKTISSAKCRYVFSPQLLREKTRLML